MLYYEIEKNFVLTLWKLQIFNRSELFWELSGHEGVGTEDVGLA